MLDQKPKAKRKAAKREGTLFQPETVAAIEADQARWEQTAVAKAHKRMPEKRVEVHTQSGMPIKRLYTPADVKQLDFNEDLGFPGEFPFTRGAQATMYRAKPWTMR